MMKEEMIGSKRTSSPLTDESLLSSKIDAITQERYPSQSKPVVARSREPRARLSSEPCFLWQEQLTDAQDTVDKPESAQ